MLFICHSSFSRPEFKNIQLHRENLFLIRICYERLLMMLVALVGKGNNAFGMG